jgi:Phospholipase B
VYVTYLFSFWFFVVVSPPTVPVLVPVRMYRPICPCTSFCFCFYIVLSPLPSPSLPFVAPFLSISLHRHRQNSYKYESFCGYFSGVHSRCINYALKHDNVPVKRTHQVMMRPGDMSSIRIVESNSVEHQHYERMGLVSCAEGGFQDRINVTGWSYLSIRTNSTACSDKDQVTAAGFYEGMITAERIYQSAINGGTTAPLPGKINDFIQEHYAWLKQQIAANSQDPYWYHVALTNFQLDALYEGFKQGVSQEHMLTKEAIWLLTYGSDIESIQAAVGVSRDEYSVGFGPGPDVGHCSALVKVIPGNQDIFVSQVTWSSLTSMLRVFKEYDFDLSMNGASSSSSVPGRVHSFSSYFGSLFSGDDYYTLDSGLVVLETTIGNSNASNWQFVKPQSVFEWTRNVVANRLATDGKSWCETFSKFNSGTYNNEFFVVDMNVFVPGSPLQDGLLYILDQIPGYIEYDDMTHVLTEQSYVPSYNVPIFPRIYELAGGVAGAKAGGPWFTYDETSRARIFRRNQSDIVDLDTMKAVMRYDNFKEDPLSRCSEYGAVCDPPYSSENSISCRGDLNPPTGVYHYHDYNLAGVFGFRNHAGTDCKITSYTLMSDSQSSVAISSPTYNQQPVFKWSESLLVNKSHIGMPDTYDFDWVTLKN